MDKLEEMSYFTSPVYVIRKPEFLDQVRAVSNKYIDKSKNKHCKGKCDDCDCKPNNKLSLMTASYSHEEQIAEFSQYVSQTAWNILSSQGYAMDNLVTYFTEMWTQEHQKYSSMETHIHGAGAQISAFYFLDAPKKGCRMVIHDPRPGKVIINLPQTDDKKITMGSPQVVFTPEPGTLIFTNSWLPHSFTRNMSNEPVRFVHMNLSVTFQAPTQDPNVEVV